mmetsp:Transcript_2577/g.3816  ORF Transcript_2577/g.3816 Transcript_2577/m.3816 type:complete len:125 (+) Transcript_2577:279-653(+)
MATGMVIRELTPRAATQGARHEIASHLARVESARPLLVSLCTHAVLLSSLVLVTLTTRPRLCVHELGWADPTGVRLVRLWRSLPPLRAGSRSAQKSNVAINDEYESLIFVWSPTCCRTCSRRYR